MGRRYFFPEFPPPMIETNKTRTTTPAPIAHHSRGFWLASAAGSPVVEAGSAWPELPVAG
jgi:hypothetical protein